ncbi:anaerobic glycerol-3-phosphate dehydrogenase subunit B [Anaeromyxobacter oryzisoli]|uniref:anaerobic glycerol-3-phosphate dehydrogenase subunit B n=1 Tax=Anaeromyxobacter oryzisoli TaxID=2925408 RepID=UPI001F561801|nr:anaerobic glycerol-3-phosphate dehydrogenase subunit B [Anaeromyxobacter sp. SG63]
MTPTPGLLEVDVLVIGAGMAGAMAALAARDAGATVAVASRAPGATALSSGAVGVAPDPTASPDEPLAWLRAPVEAARRLAARRPDHPYAAVGVAGLWRLGEALRFAARQLEPLLAPPLERPRLLATPAGNAVRAALCQRSMDAGDLLAVRGPLLVCGFAGHLAFDAALVAAGLARYTPRGGPEVGDAEVALPFDDPAARPHELARALEPPGAAERLGEALRIPAGALGAGAILLPPVLGLDPAARVPERIAAAAGMPVAETLSDVPSVPGLRLHAALEARLRVAGVARVTGEAAGAPAPGRAVEIGGTVVRAETWILASGRFVGGGIARRGALVEPALGLPVQAAEGREAGVHLARRPAASLTVRDRRAPQPLLSAGLRVDAALRPVDDRGRPVHPRLLAAGAVIGGHEQATDGSGLGVAILTGFLAGRAAARRGA